MGLFDFGKPKKSKIQEIEKLARKKRLDELRKIINSSDFKYPIKSKSYYSASYQTFLEDIRKKKKTIYEKSCELSEKYVSFAPPKEMERRLLNDINIGYLQATPQGAFSLAIWTFLILI